MEAGVDHTKKVLWAILFGYICWDIWVSRCNKLFGRQGNHEQRKATNSFFRAAVDRDLKNKCMFYKDQTELQQNHTQEEEGFVKLTTDGSTLEDGRSGYGGVIKEHNGNWICGFSVKITSVPPTIAELISYIHGLQICWSRGLRKIIILSDGKSAINLATKGCDDNHPLVTLLRRQDYSYTETGKLGSPMLIGFMLERLTTWQSYLIAL